MNNPYLTESDKKTLELLCKYLPKLKQANTYTLNLIYIFNAYSTQKPGVSQLNR